MLLLLIDTPNPVLNFPEHDLESWCTVVLQWNLKIRPEELHGRHPKIREWSHKSIDSCYILSPQSRPKEV